KVVKHYIAEAPLRTSALRTLGGYANVFALESFVDELALVAGADPVELRLNHLKDARGRAVIEAAAQRAGWQPSLLGDGTRRRGGTGSGRGGDRQRDRERDRQATPRVAVHGRAREAGPGLVRSGTTGSAQAPFRKGTASSVNRSGVSTAMKCPVFAST